MNHDDTETLSDAPEEPTAPAADSPPAPDAESDARDAEEAEPSAPADEAADAAAEARADDVTSPEAESPAPADEATTVAEESDAESDAPLAASDESGALTAEGLGTTESVTPTTTSEVEAAAGGLSAEDSEAESVSGDAGGTEAEEEAVADSVVREPARTREPDPHAEIAQAEDPEAAARAALGLDDKVEEAVLKPEEAASILAAVAATPEPEEEEAGVIQDIVLEPDLSGADLVEVFEEELVSREPSPYDRAGHWYVVHTYSGYEKKVKSNLESRVKSLHMEGRIHEVVIPMDDVIEFKGGKKVVVQKKVFPGYLLVRMDLEDETWQAVRNTPGVTAFVGGGAKPTPLSRKEVESILRVRPEEETRKARPRLDYEVGDQVRVTAGPFADFNGLIDEINVDQSTLKVLVNIFGRETPVTLDFADVAKL